MACRYDVAVRFETVRRILVEMKMLVTWTVIEERLVVRWPAKVQVAISDVGRRNGEAKQLSFTRYCDTSLLNSTAGFGEVLLIDPDIASRLFR